MSKSERRVVPAKKQKVMFQFLDALAMKGYDMKDLEPLIREYTEQQCGEKLPEPRVKPESQTIVQQYKEIFTRKYKQEPNINGKEYVIASRLVALHGLTLTSEQLDYFSQWHDQQKRNIAFTMTNFEFFWDECTARRVKEKKMKTAEAPQCGHTPPCRTAAEHSARFIEDLKASARSA